LAAALRQEPGVEVETVDGKTNELTVLVNGKTVAKKRFFFINPSIEKVLVAVKETP
jgi:hypothetical protein